MVKPGGHNNILDVPGLRVGQAQDPRLRSGVTVILPERPCVMAADVRGGGPGTREIAALAPNCLVEEFHALVLSGGSVFGLDAASGVTAALSARGLGLPLAPRPVPVVPAAILYDLGNGGDKDWGTEPPYRALGLAALDAAFDLGDRDLVLGSAGAGYGARAGALQGGVGSASVLTADGAAVAALVAVNCFGSVLMPGTAVPYAGIYEQDGEFGGLPPVPVLSLPLDAELPKAPLMATNTTIGAVATDYRLTKAEAERVVIMAQDGYARAIRPVHTPYDGDTVFVLATGERELPAPRALALTRLGAMAADCVARAVVRGVVEATAVGDAPAYRDLFRR